MLRERCRDLIQRGRTYVVSAWRYLRTKYDSLSRKQRDIVQICLFAALLLLVGLWQLSIPRLSDVDAMYARGDAAGLCSLIERYGRTERWTVVMRGAAKGALDVGDSETVIRLSRMIGDSSIAMPVRIAIVEQFGEHQLLVPGLFQYISTGNLTLEIREALVAAANKADGNVFEAEVEKKLATARELAPKAWERALKQVDDAQVYDVNGIKAVRISSTKYAVYAYGLRGLSFPADVAAIRPILERMAGLDCPERRREDAYLSHIMELLGDFERLDQLLQRDEEGKLRGTPAELRRAKQRCLKLRREIAASIRNFSFVDRGIVLR